MKSINEIEKNRKFYHKFLNINTVHRSSLTVPEFFFCETSITFLNHFIIKRGYKEVSCKLSSISKQGDLINTYTYEIKDIKVYEFNLSQIFNSKKNKVNHYLIEFFSSHNFFIPFPAVMINHFNNKFFNMVHSYNRVLNDVFENDQNNILTYESSFECTNNNRYKTFFNFCSGPFSFDGKLNLQLIKKDKIQNKLIRFNQPRLTNKNFYLSDIFKTDKKIKNKYLKILQPKQNMFYSRLLAGTCTKNFDAFSANHTYYDTSNHYEYFKNNESSKTYPYFYGFKNKLAFYPILAPCKLEIIIEIFFKNKIKKVKHYFDTTKKDPLFIDINNQFSDEVLQKVNLFNLLVRTKKGGVPKRVNHQIIYGFIDDKIPLNTSINVSLNNKEIFQPKFKKGFRWGQVVCGKDYISRLGVLKNLGFSSNKTNNKLKISFYDENGKISVINKKIEKYKSIIFDLNEHLNIKMKKKVIWFTIESDETNVLALSFHLNKKTKFSSGEHAF